MKEQSCPQGLFCSLLTGCHPGLDQPYLDPSLVPEELLLAGRFPQLVAQSGLDPLRIAISHGCDLSTFTSRHLNEVLRGEKSLYAGLPALEIRAYHKLLRMSPSRRSCLHQRSALTNLSMEAGPSVDGRQEPLRRWQPSLQDQLAQPPLVLIVASGLDQAYLQARSLGAETVIQVNDLRSAELLCRDAAARTLKGGGHYLLWKGEEAPAPIWGDWIRGLLELRQATLLQVGLVDGGIAEVLPPRFQRQSSLLAIRAHWLARRRPQQIKSFVRHWLDGPSLPSKVRLDPDLVQGPAPIARPASLKGLLIVAATAEQVRQQGYAELLQRARCQAARGGFEDGVVLQLAIPLAEQVESFPRQGWMWSFMGPEDEVLPAACSWLRQRLSWQPEQFLCSDEEVLWCTKPKRHGLRQFAAAPTPLRVLCRGLLPGLVTLNPDHWWMLNLNPTYTSLHALLRHMGLRWLSLNRPLTCLPQALLHRHPQSNPAVLPISTPDQRACFSLEQLQELQQIIQDGAEPWLAVGGSLEAGGVPGTFAVRYCPNPQDRVSVIIPYRNQARLTRSCVLSLLKQKGTVPLEVVLLDNGSTEPDAVNLAEELQEQASASGVLLLALRDERPFNFAAINNRALQSCSGNFVLFLNNDICFESPAPIEALLHPFGLTVTGAVGARLLYEDGTIQHHGLAAVAGQAHDILSPGKELRPGHETDSFTVLNVQEEWSAATAACLLVRRSDLNSLGGFDESFEVAYNDIDLCWRLTQEDRTVVVTPEPRIIHSESKTRGGDISGDKRYRLAQESAHLRRLFPQYFQQGDPLYHPFLSPTSHRFEPMALPAQPVILSRDRLLYSWTNPSLKPRSRGNFVIYVHWDSKGKIRPDVLEQLRAYHQHADVAFVSASPELIDRDQLLSKLKRHCDVIIIRHNEGYDFGSWKAGIQFCKRWIKNCRRLILANDSCYGPLWSLDLLFKQLDRSSADVVGLTGSTTMRHHLQSYFLAYRKRVVHTPLFWEFWEQIGCWDSKAALVQAYEVGWSHILEDAGFSMEALYLDGEHGNITHTHWRQLLEDMKFPFIKTELLRVNPLRRNIDDWYSIASAINPATAELIKKHLRMTT